MPPYFQIRPILRPKDLAMRRITSFVIIAVASLLLFCQFSMGQAVYGNILGTVTDKSGAAVPNVDVKITDLDRGTTSQVKTNESGNYEQTHLLAGRYKVSVAASGFAAFEATAEVQIDASTRVDIPLGVKGETTKVRSPARLLCSKSIAPT